MSYYRSSGQVGSPLTATEVASLAERGVTVTVGTIQTTAHANTLAGPVPPRTPVSTLPAFGSEEFQRHQYQKHRMGQIIGGVAAGLGLAAGIVSRMTGM